jgi:hypothetical protein
VCIVVMTESMQLGGRDPHLRLAMNKNHPLACCKPCRLFSITLTTYVPLATYMHMLAIRK